MLGFYMKFLAKRDPYMTIINVFRWVIGLTYISVILSVFLECRPFHKLIIQTLKTSGDLC